MPDEFPGYEYLGEYFGPVGSDDADLKAEAFYQTKIWLHRPCGVVVADRQAHDGWCGDEPLEQRLIRLKLELRRDLLAELRATGGLR